MLQQKELDEYVSKIQKRRDSQNTKKIKKYVLNIKYKISFISLY